MPVKGWEGLYDISSEGRVFSRGRVFLAQHPTKGEYISSFPAKMLALNRGKNGYVQMQFVEGDRKERHYLHILVLEHFKGPCPEGMEGCHNNGVRHDCRVDNLRWDTRTNNALDRHAHGTFDCVPKGEDNFHHKLTDADVRCIRSSASSFSQRELAAMYGVSHTTIGTVLRRTAWKHIT